MEKALQVNGVLSKINNIGESITSMIKEGLVSGRDTLLLYAGLKEFTKILSNISKDDENKDIFLTEFEKFGEKTVKIGEFKLSKRKYGSYDFSGCGHPIIEATEHITMIMKDYVKVAKDQCKAISPTAINANNKVVIDRATMESLKTDITVLFSTLMDFFPEDENFGVFELNPPIFKGSEQVTATKIKK